MPNPPEPSKHRPSMTCGENTPNIPESRVLARNMVRNIHVYIYICIGIYVYIYVSACFGIQYSFRQGPAFKVPMPHNQ